ncbi:hypothetical protein L7F22_025495 [Adiantum nelumboides]|nr:hypothetical protein [Adiantum nelumboides]
MGQKGYGSLVKGSMLVVLWNLHQLLHLAVLCLLVPSLVWGALYNVYVASAAYNKNHALGNVLLTCAVSLTSEDWIRLGLPAQITNHAKISRANIDVVCKLATVFCLLGVRAQMKEVAYVDHEAFKLMTTMQSMLLVVLLVLVGSAIYATQRLAKSSSYIDEQADTIELQNRSGRRSTLATFYGITFWVLFGSFFHLTDQLVLIFADAERHGWWPIFSRMISGLVLGISSAGLLPLLLLSCLLSTQAALYLSCKAYTSQQRRPHLADANNVSIPPISC